MGASDWFAPILFFTLIGMLILGPALRYGFIFLLDMPWPQHFQLSDFTAGNASLLPISVILTVLNKIIPAWVLQKILLVGIITMAGFSMYRMHRHLRVPRSRRYAAGLLYACNPFVLERLAGGQWLLLWGYAMVPFFVSRLLMFAKDPIRRNAVRLGLLYALYPVVSVHWWYMLTLFTAPLAIHWLYIRLRQKSTNKKALLGYVASTCAAVALINYRWIVDVVQGVSKVTTISTADFRVFATAGEGMFGAVGNVISLYGFWQRLYVMPSDHGLVAWTLPLLLLALTVAGASRMYERHGRVALYPFALLPLVMILAAGFGSPVTMPLTSIFVRIIPGYAGLRDTAKLVGLIAFIYALYLPAGLAQLQAELKKIWSLLGNRRFVSGSFMAIFTVVMLSGLWGLGSQLRAYPYPHGWAEAETYLQVQGAKKIVVLPWRGYINLRFANDTFAANPARLYFTPEVIQSRSVNNLILDTAQQDTEYDALATELLRGSAQAALGAYQQKGIEFVVLLKTADWQNYSYRLHDKTPVYENDDIAVYKL